MANGSNNGGPNARVIEVMNFLAANPTESFTMTEIASRLGLSNGSAHRVLTTLAESRYLSRHPKHKTYSLGMALVAIGQAALAKHRDIEIARRELARLAADIQAQCVATTIADNELLVLACEGTPQASEPLNQIGERRPFIPPLGICYAAWFDSAAQADYLARAPAALTDEVHDRLARSLGIIAERGYAITGSGPVLRALRQLTSLPIRRQDNETFWAGLRQLLADMSVREIQLLDLDEAGPEGIAYITAPVFSPNGEVVLELCINGLAANLDKAAIEHSIERLRTAAAVITRETHGRMPPQAAQLDQGRSTASKRQPANT